MLLAVKPRSPWSMLTNVLKGNRNSQYFGFMSASRFKQDCLQIGRLAGIFGFNNSACDPKQSIRDWLSSNDAGTWLLIVDSADDTDVLFGNREAGRPLVMKGFSEFIPQSSNGSILFTNRNKKAGSNLLLQIDVSYCQE